MRSGLVLLSCLFSCHRAPCPENMIAIQGGPARIGEAPTTERWHVKARDVQVEPYCMDQYEYPNQKGEYPKVSVSWLDARRLCMEQGKRLCTDDEWERACRGPDRRLYPYGNERDLTRCNTPRRKGEPPSRSTPYARAGDHPGCVSAEGVEDLDGNVSEWVDEVKERDIPDDLEKLGWRPVRGGTMWDDTFYGFDCTSFHRHPPTDPGHDDDGFRCCQDQR